MSRYISQTAYRGLILLCGTALFGFAAYAAAWAEPTSLERLFIIVLLTCTCGALIFAFGRIATALLISGGLFLLLRFISTTKLRYLGSPLMPADFIYFARSSLVETLSHYPHFARLGIVLGILIPTMLILVWRGDYRIFTRNWKGCAFRLAGLCFFLLSSWVCLLPHGPFTQIMQKAMWLKLSDAARLTNFFATIHDYEIHIPKINEPISFTQRWVTSGKDEKDRKPYPDIIQVLEESTFDPSYFTGCNIPQCKVAMLQPDNRTLGHGLLRTHTAGGGTWVSEFSSLTGLPQDIFGPAGMYAPFVLASRVRYTLPKLLTKLGYHTVAIYPVNGNFINARNAYHAYGFNEFYDATDLKIPTWGASDTQLFSAAKLIYDRLKKPSQPVFMMILTLEQHGPHDNQPLSALPAPFNQGLIQDLSADQALNLSTYLSRLLDSDRGMHQLEHDFLDRPTPTVIMHFGDHQPSFGGLIRSMQRIIPDTALPYREYLTYYMLKSNAIGPKLPSYPVLDIAYLPSLVLQAADIPPNEYFSALGKFRIYCDGLYTDCPDKSTINSYYNRIFNQLDQIQ